MKKLFFLLSILFIYIFPANGQQQDSFVENLLQKMSVEEKFGQLNQIDGRIDEERLAAMIRQGKVSSLMNIVDPVEVDKLQKIAVEESPSGIPILFARDVIHGFKTILPIPLGQAASFNPAMVYKGARMAAKEATAQGIRWGFAPMVDVSRDPRWGRIAESFGEDHLMNAVMGMAQVEGYQTEDLSSPDAMAACVKHFVGYGAAEGGKDYNGSHLTERALREIYLYPFKKVMQNGCETVMTSFQDNDGLQAAANDYLLKDVVRSEWGWDGVVVSDYGSIGQLTRHGNARNSGEAGKIALNSGVDMDMMSHAYVKYGPDSLAAEAIDLKTLDEAVARVLKLKLKLGLFENPYVRSSDADSHLSERLELAEKVSSECAVLLKNDGILPLQPGKRLKVLVTGPLADAPYDQLGTWNMDGDTSLTVTPMKAFRSISSTSFQVEYIPGLDYSRDMSKKQFKAVRKAAEKADVVLAFMGEEQILSGEAHSLCDIDLIGLQKEFIDMLSSTGTPLIMTVIAGRPLTIEEEVEKSSAVIYAFHPGTMGGAALADIITGKVNPSAKLPVTFPRHVGQVPVYYNAIRHGRQLSNKKSRPIYEIPRSVKQSVLGHSCTYLDYGDKPLFPFGYGLSYTDFEIQDVRFSETALSSTDTLTINLRVKNTGSCAGADVIQVYIRDLVSSMSRPVKELKGFKKVYLEAGQVCDVCIEMPVSEWGFYDKDMSYVVEKGEFTLQISDCSDPELSNFVFTKSVFVTE